MTPDTREALIIIERASRQAALRRPTDQLLYLADILAQTVRGNPINWNTARQTVRLDPSQICGADSPGVYGCPKGGENGIHHWEANDDGIYKCLRCDLELSAEDSYDMKMSNRRWFRELTKSRKRS